MNDHAAEVLDAYLDAETLIVPHAILIEGAWGSGKTHFLEKIYEPQRRERFRKAHRHHTPFLFVSLFGATSAQDVEMRVYRTACPGEAVAGSLAGTFALGLGEFFKVKDATKVVLDQVAKKAIKRLNDFVFVFDDLERIERSAFGEIMGLVNSFVTTHGRRVILVTNELKLQELFDEGKWNERNEKVIGRRARIRPDADNVIRAFLEELRKGPVKKRMTDYLPDLIEIARSSGVENLRNLSWAMHNAARFTECLLADPEIPADHVARTLSVVLATTLWYRTGKLNESALGRLPGLSNRLAMRSLVQRGTAQPAAEEADTSMAEAFSQTFSTLNVESPPVDYGMIVEFEKSGVLKCEEVNSWIKTQFGYGNRNEEPAWRKLWYSYERPREETERALADLAGQFQRYEHTGRGVILHAAGLAIKFRDANDLTLTGGQEIVPFFHEYIDALANGRRLQLDPIEPLPLEYGGHGGLGFTSKETDEFQEIFRHLAKRQNELAAAIRSERVEVILREAEGGDFGALMHLVRNDDPELSRFPVLLDVDIERVASLMTVDLPALNAGGKLLAYRYHHQAPDSPVLQELHWARDVLAAVEEKLDQWPDPHRTLALSSFRGLIRHYDGERDPNARLILDASPERDAN